eukprot:2746-Heterocapsa_arctica.AAC.1
MVTRTCSGRGFTWKGSRFMRKTELTFSFRTSFTTPKRNFTLLTGNESDNARVSAQIVALQS